MRTLRLGIDSLLVVLTFVSGTHVAYATHASARAAIPDRPLLVSARFYTPLSRPWDKSYYHIYRMNADGSGKTQLSFQPHDDTAACWSPDGKHIAFARSYAPSSYLKRYGPSDIQICTQAARPNAKPRVILHLHDAQVAAITWSGDGSCLAVEVGQKLLLATSQGTVLRQMKTEYRNFLGFAPDGKHYAVSTVEGIPYSVESLSGKKTRLPNPGVWWDSKTFLSWSTRYTTWNNTNDMEGESITTLPLTFTDLKGNVLKTVDLRPTPDQRKYFLEEQQSIVPIWEAARVGPTSPLLYFGFGKPREHLFADLRTGLIRRWPEQETGVYPMHLSPDGRYGYAQCGFKDIAPYGTHRDGRKRYVSVNTLQITTMKELDQTYVLLSGLVHIDSVDWLR